MHKGFSFIVCLTVGCHKPFIQEKFMSKIYILKEFSAGGGGGKPLTETKPVIVNSSSSLQESLKRGVALTVDG